MKECLEALGLGKSYRKKRVLDNVSIRVGKGEIVGLLGPNGAGKTTAFSLILGLIPQDSGRVFLDGEDITEFPMYLRARKGISLLPQEPSAFRKLSVEDNISSIQEVHGGFFSREDGELQRTLEEFGLEGLTKAKAYTLSGGERRRLEIVRALVTDPVYLLLDEPFTGIDPLAVFDLQNIILSLKTKGIGLLVTDHNVRDTLKITDKAYILDGGQILEEGTPGELISSEAVRRKYLGEDFNMD